MTVWSDLSQDWDLESQLESKPQRSNVSMVLNECSLMESKYVRVDTLYRMRLLFNILGKPLLSDEEMFKIETHC